MTPQNYAPKHSAVIASIVPAELVKVLAPMYRPLFQPVSKYALEPGTPEKPFHLEIRDAYQPEYKGEHVGNQQMPVLAERIAADMVKEFTERIPGWAEGQHLGVFLCAGEQATDEEILAALAAQDRFLAKRIEAGDELWKRDGTTKNISTLSRAACSVMNVERPWLFDIKSDTRECPNCAERIKSKANVCIHCKVNIASYLAGEAKKAAAIPPPVKQPTQVNG